MLKIIEKDIDQLIPYENNPRNNDGAVEAVAASIKNFGFKIPVVIDKDGVVVCGHTRIKSAKRLGMKKVPCIIADDLTDEQIRAFRLADNKTGELAEWDFERLRDELEALKDIDMSAFGFEDLLQEADELTLEDVEEDDFDEEKIDKEAPKAKRGDIYQLGDHRLMCGDSTNPDDLRELMGGCWPTWYSRIRLMASLLETRTRPSTASRRLDAASRISQATPSTQSRSIQCSWLRLLTSARTERGTTAATTSRARKAETLA